MERVAGAGDGDGHPTGFQVLNMVTEIERSWNWTLGEARHGFWGERVLGEELQIIRLKKNKLFNACKLNLGVFLSFAQERARRWVSNGCPGCPAVWTSGCGVGGGRDALSDELVQRDRSESAPLSRSVIRRGECKLPFFWGCPSESPPALPWRAVYLVPFNGSPQNHSLDFWFARDPTQADRRV